MEYRIRGKYCLWYLESWALDSGIKLKESGIPPEIGIWNPSYTDKDWNPVPGIPNPWHTMQNPRLSWIPLHGAIESFLTVSNLLYHLFTNCDWIFRLIRRFYWSKISNWRKRLLNVVHRQVHKNISQRSLAGQFNHCTLNCDIPYKYPIVVHLASYQNETDCAFLPVLFVPWGINETATTEIPAAIM